MGKFTHPSKEVVREYMRNRKVEHCPPPDIKEIRRQIGWALLKRAPKK